MKLDNFTEVAIPVGEKNIHVKVPNLVSVILPRNVDGVADEGKEVRRALANPIGSKRLRQIAEGKKTAAIVVNDITRPYPAGLLVEEIIKELHLGGLDDENIFIVIAYGMHRTNTDNELRRILGDRIIDRFRIVHHRANEKSSLVALGFTENGLPVEVNREYASADVKILTGLITPHQSAGFSGGRKSVVPGISGIECLKIHHSFPVRPKEPSMGWLVGNPFHELALEAARIVGVDFIVNTIDNADRKMIAAVAGDLNEAHIAGTEICRSIWEVTVPSKADVVIVSPGGYPRDIDLHQSQKACACAELICKPGGKIILCAEARDGTGKFGKVLYDALKLDDVMEKYTKEGYTAESAAKAYMYARVMSKYRLGLACSRIAKQEAEKMFMTSYRSVEEGISDALGCYGMNATFIVIPYASDIIPRVEQMEII